MLFGLITVNSVWEHQSNLRRQFRLQEGWFPLAVQLTALQMQSQDHLAWLEGLANTNISAEQQIELRLKWRKLGEWRMQQLETIERQHRPWLELEKNAETTASNHVWQSLARLKQHSAQLERLYAAALSHGGALQTEAHHVDALVRKETDFLPLIQETSTAVSYAIKQLSEVTKREREMAWTRLIWFGAAAVVIALVLSLFLSQELRPLTQLERRVMQVGKGNLEPHNYERLPNNEIGRLAIQFEGMVESLLRREREEAKTKQQLLQSEKLATIGKLFAHVTHEIRNPLSSISLNVEWLCEEIPALLKPTSSETTRDVSDALNALRSISKEIERLRGLSDRYLSMTKTEPTALHELDMGVLIEEVLSVYALELKQKGCEVSLHGHSGVKVRANADILKQVLGNLIKNAWESQHDAVRISVVVITSLTETRVFVSDSGPGIPPDRVEKIFDFFSTDKKGGTGLGLSFSKQLLQSMGSELMHVAPERRPQGCLGGACFEIKLPQGGPIA